MPRNRAVPGFREIVRTIVEESNRFDCVRFTVAGNGAKGAYILAWEKVAFGTSTKDG
ncbi:UNVERIFIED_ORG: hypothetical protein ABIB19_001449 [Arthrobacter sp. UYEF10]